VARGEIEAVRNLKDDDALYKRNFALIVHVHDELVVGPVIRASNGSRSGCVLLFIRFILILLLSSLPATIRENELECVIEEYVCNEYSWNQGCRSEF